VDPIRVAIVGLGKIARDQHVPALFANGDFTLAAVVSPDGAFIDGVPRFDTMEDLLGDGSEIDAVALCTPPQVRRELAAAALGRGLHVLLEKPPAATPAEAAALEEQASANGATLFAAWHSRFAAGVEAAREWLAEREVLGATITWREDVRKWHPGQAWIWQAGGLGVFDPGINALSIATRVLPRPLSFADAELDIPANCDSPIAARLELRDTHGVPVAVDFDFRQTGPQTWDIAVETDAGPLLLSHGGATLTLAGNTRRGEDREYAGLYARFAELIRQGRSEVDTAPLQLVAEALERGRVNRVKPFYD
jgi:D-galactose 1-dehydrogenase